MFPALPALWPNAQCIQYALTVYMQGESVTFLKKTALAEGILAFSRSCVKNITPHGLAPAQGLQAMLTSMQSHNSPLSTSRINTAAEAMSLPCFARSS